LFKCFISYWNFIVCKNVANIKTIKTLSDCFHLGTYLKWFFKILIISNFNQIENLCMSKVRTCVKFFKMSQLNLQISKYSKCFYFKICSWSYSILLVSCSNLFSEKVWFDNTPNLNISTVTHNYVNFF
jgi:hypothetical protein